MTLYAKAILAIITAALAALAAALTDGALSSAEAVTIGIAIVTAVGVYLVPNLDAGPARYAKAFVAAAGAGLAALATLLAEGLGLSQVTLSDWITVLLAILGAVGVGIVPNVSPAIIGEIEILEPDPA